MLAAFSDKMWIPWLECENNFPWKGYGDICNTLNVCIFIKPIRLMDDERPNLFFQWNFIVQLSRHKCCFVTKASPYHRELFVLNFASTWISCFFLSQFSPLKKETRKKSRVLAQKVAVPLKCTVKIWKICFALWIKFITKSNVTKNDL